MTDRKSLEFTGVEQIVELVQTLTSHLQLYVSLLSSSLIHSDKKEVILQRIEAQESRNDSYLALLQETVQQAIFLPISTQDFRLLAESIDETYELVERIAHRLCLLPLPSWVTEHLANQFQIIDKMITTIANWTNTEKQAYQEDFKAILALEEQGDGIHRAFLQQLFEADLNFKLFYQTQLLDDILEGVIDSLQVLAQRALVVVYQIRGRSTDTRYLR